jgi:hypothetical protein
MANFLDVHHVCGGALEARYPGLRFDVKWRLRYDRGEPRSELDIIVRGTREDLLRHMFMTPAGFSLVPSCGITHRVPCVYRMSKLKQGYWRLEIHRQHLQQGRTENPLHRTLMSLLELKVPELHEWMDLLLQRRMNSSAAVSGSPPAKKINAKKPASRPASNNPRSRTVGRFQRLVTWQATGNLIMPNWTEIQAQVARRA